MAETALEREQRVGRDLAVRFGRMVAGSVAVVEVVNRTNELPRTFVRVENSKGEVQLVPQLARPDGMSDAEWNLHCDAMLPSKMAPLYLHGHMNRVALAQRIAGDRSNAPQELAKLVISVVRAEPKRYDVIDVTATGDQK